MKIKVTRKYHNDVRGGRLTAYAPGEEFDGDKSLLKKLGDRVADPRTQVVEEDNEADPLEELRLKAQVMGIKVDARWGEERLKQEIAKVEGGGQ